MATATARVGVQKDVHTLINDKVIELLDKGTIPWLRPWTAGIPRNLISQKPYRNINLLLLSCLGYDRNIFIRENQMKSVGASILPGERPHMVAFWSYNDANGNKQVPQLRYYLVYNVAQCSNIPDELVKAIVSPPFSPDECQRIVADMPHLPEIRSKEQMPYYDVLEDYINMPKPKSFKTEADQYAAMFHQLMHCMGHHTRLDRPGLVQMAEYGYTGPSQEELVAEIGGRYLEAMTGIVHTAVWNDEYMQAHKAKVNADRNFIFTTASYAQKAIDFILNENADVEEATVAE